MCLYPLKQYVYHDSVTGQVIRTFKSYRGVAYEVVTLPCGKCIECLSHYSNEWALRCSIEAGFHSENCFVTLTYKHCNSSLVKSDLTDFIKRLRERLSPLTIRYFGCGEYGSKGSRPHYHLIIFGWKPSDLQFFFRRDGQVLYKSKFVEDVWHGGRIQNGYVRGYVTVGTDVNLRNARYCAKYLQKLNNISYDCAQPFTLMSLKPGIGYRPGDTYSSTDLYLNGKRYSLPRYLRRKCGLDKVKSSYRDNLDQIMRSSLPRRLKEAKLRFKHVRVWRRHFDLPRCSTSPAITYRDD